MELVRRFYSPPDWLNIWGLLESVSLHTFQQNMDFFKQVKPLVQQNLFSDYGLYHLEKEEELENLDQEGAFPQHLSSLVEIKVRLHATVDPEIFFYPIPFQKIKNRDEILWLKALFGARQLVRYYLTKNQLVAYLDYDGQYEAIQPTVWNSDKNWYRLLVDGHFVRPYTTGGRVYFKADQLASLQAKNASIQPESQLLEEFYKKERAGDLTLRASMKLFIQSALNFTVHNLDKETKRDINKKGGLEEEIEKLAKKMGFKVLTGQTELSLERRENTSIEENCVSRLDIKSIATCLRPLLSQINSLTQPAKKNQKI